MLVPHDPFPRSCKYCGQPLQRGFYFCTACAMPHSEVEEVLPVIRPVVWDDETRVRRLAPEVWQLFLAYMGAILAASVVSWIADPKDEGSIPMLILSLLAVAGVSLVLGIRHRETLRPQFAGLGLLSRHFALGLLMLGAVLLVDFGWHGMLYQLAPEEWKKNMLKDVSALVPSVAGRIFLICVMPAVFEEIGFRGLAQTWLMKVISPWKAVMVAAALFSAAHFTVLSAPYLLLAGALFGWMRWRSGLIFPSMLLHFLHNLAVLWYEGLLR